MAYGYISAAGGDPTGIPGNVEPASLIG
jgi:hypothetical protein